ncbi:MULTISPECIES: hypothetical protein [Edaphosphingomonas]|uniref:Lipoprotein n=2 Tax=Edaphosphingomonas TaxID=3423724 RepID=A0A2T4I825_9SPHN|nr:MULTISPECIES: hypothetical protein [Sphingomonas]OHT21912.1 hypothetical protein BHE75_03925 [Sphingomonas haloaromaticamans]PTD27587.1 hypothetical protein CV103_01435 [Sphingomonas fennica]
MRVVIAAPVLMGLALSGCGPKALTLPDDPIDRAATCGVVAALGARAAGGGNVAAALPFDRQAGIMHYALLAGAEGKSFDQSRAAAVAARMPQLEAGISAGKWQDLAPACAAAYPQTQEPAGGPIDLPQDALRAETGCYALGAFLNKTLGGPTSAYKDRLAEFTPMNRALDAKIGAGIAARGLKPDAAVALRSEALATMVKLGPPAGVMASCVARFTPKG